MTLGASPGTAAASVACATVPSPPPPPKVKRWFCSCRRTGHCGFYDHALCEGARFYEWEWSESEDEGGECGEPSASFKYFWSTRRHPDGRESRKVLHDKDECVQCAQCTECIKCEHQCFEAYDDSDSSVEKYHYFRKKQEAEYDNDTESD